ncbi:hypothetical protein LQW54_011034 [Pestalotiopsis sp. IQ-011]
MGKMSYRVTDTYKWYENKKRNIRRSTLPPFEMDDQGRVFIAAGEVYCRFPSEHDLGELCFLNKKFSNRSSLVRHIKTRHGADPAPTRMGALSGSHDDETFRFYRGLRHLANGNPTDLVTPKRRTSSTDAPSTGGKKSKVHKDVGNSQINAKESPGYKAAVHGAGCSKSADKDRACPPSERHDTCLVRAANPESVAGPTAAQRAYSEVRMASEQWHDSLCDKLSH